MKTLEEHLSKVISQSHKRGRPLKEGECQSPQGSRCTLCHAVDLTYEEEVSLKEEALQTHWKEHFSLPLLSRLVASPFGRGYRTVTKRRAFHVRGSVRLGLIAPAEEGSYKPFDVVECAIEPEGHAPIYRKVQEILEKPYAQPLADVLSYMIIKGNYMEYAVMINVRKVSPDVARAVNTLSKSLTHIFPAITSVFLYQDESSGRYYLGRSNKGKQPTVRKVFGKPDIHQRICGRSFLYSPLTFSQVNQSIADVFVTCAGELLALDKATTLLDLYCGYGLFALCLADKSHSVLGVEVSPEAIASAIHNAKRQKISNVRFLRSNITADSVARMIQPAHGRTVVLLDPPRSGTAEGVIECIAARKPARVVHIFCNIDIMPAELTRWTDDGYALTKAIPFDMFPGTSSIEMMVLLERA